MKLKINGEVKEFDKELKTISDLLTELDIKRPERVAVEINNEIIMQSDFGSTAVKDDDSIEIVSFVGGG
jgi:sulfur carrier protein